MINEAKTTGSFGSKSGPLELKFLEFSGFEKNLDHWVDLTTPISPRHL